MKSDDHMMFLIQVCHLYVFLYLSACNNLLGMMPLLVSFLIYFCGLCLNFMCHYKTKVLSIKYVVSVLSQIFFKPSCDKFSWSISALMFKMISGIEDGSSAHTGSTEF